MPRLVDKAHIFPGACLRCQSNGADSGPYLDTETFTPKDDLRVYFCRSCTGQIVRAVDVVPKAVLDAAIAREKSVEAAEIAAREAHAKLVEAESKLASVSAQLEVANSRINSFELADLERVNAKAREQREALLREVATPTKSTKKAKVTT